MDKIQWVTGKMMRKIRGFVIGLVLVSICNNSICYATDVTVDANTTEVSSETTETTTSTTITISATEIDMGDYQTSMLVGEKQLLSVTVLPTDTTDQTVTYQSSNTSVATINSMGRITAASAGTTQITVTCGSVQNGFQLTVKQSSDVAVTDVEIGNYEAEMEVGKTQTLSATVLPNNATNATLTYKSSDTKIATVLSTGEVKAVAAGTVTITVGAGTITKNVQITVKEAATATEIDLGDYQTSMAIGEKQLISATVLPTTATTQTLTYQSSNEEVATVNEMGRITALSVGKTKITVLCGTVKNSFQLTVKKTNDILVSDIEIENYEEELNVDKTQTISATVKPSNATDTTVTYTSSDTSIATVLSSGEVKGISPGTVTITVSAGDISKNIQLTIKEATAKIDINNNYVVLKPEEEFQLKASVQPSNASQSLTYKSADSSIASVSGSGNITAKSIGTTSILVSNGDLSAAVTVIVNESGVAEKSEVEAETVTTVSESVENLSEQEAKIIEQIRNTKDSDIEINSAEYPVISKNILKALYETKQILQIKGTDYTLRIDGSNIANYENELVTQLQFMKEEEGTSFIINENKNLPGSIELTIQNTSYTGKYLYLYNQTKEKYQLIKNEKNTSERMMIDTTGKYLTTDEKITTARIGIIIIVVLGIGVLIASGVYIGVKKKYWFW
jgi:uncharacterized protein YjdB